MLVPSRSDIGVLVFDIPQMVTTEQFEFGGFHNGRSEMTRASSRSLSILIRLSDSGEVEAKRMPNLTIRI